jgi:hypothetical protein
MMQSDKDELLLPWLDELMGEALRSQEWQQLSQTIMQNVDDKLGNRGLKMFSDLPGASKH